MIVRIVVGLLFCGPAFAQTIPHAEACVATLPGTGRAVLARERLGAISYTAYASYDPDGWPTITYAPAFFILPAPVQRFLSLHECGHLVLQTHDEFQANCYAIAEGRWTRAELALIEQSHLNVRRLPPQYGGSGAAFWNGTRRTCPEYFR